MRKILLIGLIILQMLVLASCKFLVSKPRMKRIQDIKVLSISPDKTELAISIEIANPNPFRLEIQSLELNLSDKERKPLGEARISKSYLIPKKSSAFLDIRLSLDTRKATKLISHSLALQLWLKGSGKGKALGISRSFSFEEPLELSLKKHLDALIPKFTALGQDLIKIQDSSIRLLGLGETEIRIRFLLLNPYGLAFTLKALPTQVFIGDKAAGSGYLEQELTFSEDIFYKEGCIILKVNNLKSFTSAFKGVFKGEIPYALKGQVQIQAFGSEFNRDFELKNSLNLSITDLLLK